MSNQLSSALIENKMPRQIPRSNKGGTPKVKLNNSVSTSNQAQDKLNTNEDQIKKEIGWCVDQLRMGIFTQKPNEKQAKECDRVLRILTSSKTSLVKKRQAMHQMFGDYRKKIQEEESKWEKDMAKSSEKFSLEKYHQQLPHGQFLRVATTKKEEEFGLDNFRQQASEVLFKDSENCLDKETKGTHLHKFDFKIDEDDQ